MPEIDASPAGDPVPPSMPRNGSLENGPPSSSHEQPDKEPDTQSIPPEGPVGAPTGDVPEASNPVEVPVPDSSDEDGLYLNDEVIYHLQQEHGFKLKVDIHQKDINHWKEEPRPHEMAFLVSAAKRQGSEVKISDLSPTERKLFEDAKMKEVESWLSTETVSKILRYEVPKEQAL